MQKYMSQLVKGNEKPGWGKRARCFLINLPDEWENSKCWKLFGSSIPKTIDTKAKNYSAADEEVGIIPGKEGIPQKYLYEIHPILVDVLDILYGNQIVGIDLISIINDEIMNGNFSVKNFNSFLGDKFNDLEKKILESYYAERNEIEKATEDTFPYIKSENIEQNNRSIPRRLFGQCLRTQLVKNITCQIIERYKDKLKKQLQDYYSVKYPNDIEKQNNEYLEERIEVQKRFICKTPGRIERFEGAGITTIDTYKKTYDKRGTSITFKKGEFEKLIPVGIEESKKNNVTSYSCLYGLWNEKKAKLIQHSKIEIPQAVYANKGNNNLAQNIVDDSRIIGRTSNIGKCR